MCVFSFVPPAPPWDAASLHVSSTFCCPLLPLGCGTFPRFVQGCCSSVLCRNQPAFTQTMFYTKQFLQKPTFTQTLFSTNHLLHPFTPTSSYTNALLHKPASKQTNCSTNQLLHKPPLQPTFTIRFYTNQRLPYFTTKKTFTQTYTHDLLDKPPLTQTTFYIDQLLQPSFYANHFFDKPTKWPADFQCVPSSNVPLPSNRRRVWLRCQQAGANVLVDVNANILMRNLGWFPVGKYWVISD